MKVTKERRAFYVIALEEPDRDLLVETLIDVAAGNCLESAQLDLLDALRVAILNEG